MRDSVKIANKIFKQDSMKKYLGDQLRPGYNTTDEELDKYNLVRKYLLNESDSLDGKPFLWIHTKHKINARNWQSFYSRNSKRLNQPYKDLCVESIVNHCSDSFKICLIDANLKILSIN